MGAIQIHMHVFRQAEMGIRDNLIVQQSGSLYQLVGIPMDIHVFYPIEHGSGRIFEQGSIIVSLYQLVDVCLNLLVRLMLRHKLIVSA